LTAFYLFQECCASDSFSFLSATSHNFAQSRMRGNYHLPIIGKIVFTVNCTGYVNLIYLIYLMAVAQKIQQ